MQKYGDDLVELGNQAWILNVALAELHCFQRSVEQHIQASSERGLETELNSSFRPAIKRLSARLDALLVKWRRRIVLESPALASLVPEAQPWGYRLAIPAPIRAQMQVQSGEQMTLAAARKLAATHPEQFVLFTRPDRDSEDGSEESDTALLVDVTRFSGVHLSVSKMWWSWWFSDTNLYCRQQALTDNLWEMSVSKTASPCQER